MKKNAIIFIVLALIISSCNKRVEIVAEEPLCTSSLNLFTLRNVNDILRLWDEPEFVDKGVFISLSDIHELIRHPDSLAIPASNSGIDWRGRWSPDLKGEELFLFFNEMDERQFFHLDEEYRRRFLERTKISETDIVFLYNYADDALLAFPVNELNVAVVARHFPHTCQYNYRIGFHMDRVLLYESDESNDFDLWEFERVLVYIGQAHPFARGGMREIQWRRIPTEDFPIAKSNIETDNERILYLLEYGRRSARAYLYEFENFILFSQDILRFWSAHNRWNPAALHLLIIDTEIDSVVVERVIPNGWGWYGRGTRIGNLFRNAPPVALGFWWPDWRTPSDLCPFIMFLDAEIADVYIRCDNQSTAAIIARTRIVDYNKEQYE